jgi:hypothetical protein
MAPIQTFWCEPTGLVRVALRAFTFGDPGDDIASHIACPAVEPRDGYRDGHRAQRVALEAAPRRMTPEGFYEVWPVDEFRDDQWPDVCDVCGDPVTDAWQRVVDQREWYRADGIGQWTVADLPPGAMYDAKWYGSMGRTGPDGISLVVVCPPGALHSHWNVDGTASNCGLRTEPDGLSNEEHIEWEARRRRHRCWCRSGDPRAANVTVDKSCETCEAGAGSIAIGSEYHGFLRDGMLVDA